MAEGLRLGGQPGIDVRQGVRTVDFRLPGAQQIEIGAVQHQQSGHVGLTNGRSMKVTGSLPEIPHESSILPNFIWS